MMGKLITRVGIAIGVVVIILLVKTRIAELQAKTSELEQLLGPVNEPRYVLQVQREGEWVDLATSTLEALRGRRLYENDTQYYFGEPDKPPSGWRVATTRIIFIVQAPREAAPSGASGKGARP